MDTIAIIAEFAVGMAADCLLGFAAKMATAVNRETIVGIRPTSAVLLG
jgi:hypothetical protein